MIFAIDFFLLLYLFAMGPKLFWDRIFKGKRHPRCLQRLGFDLPRTEEPLIWIHAVSVGEIKAALPLFEALKEKEKGAFFLITTTSATGQAEAKRLLPKGDAFAYLPIDLSWVVKRWVRKLNPAHFILIESDFWFNLLSALKKQGTRISLASGKLSEKSARRFRYIPFFSKTLFSFFDHLCVQNEEHKNRFAPLIRDLSKLHVTGNLKLDLKKEPILKRLKLPSEKTIAISCTHPGEEELLLDALQGENDWFFLLAPRHPERFSTVAELLERKKIPFTRWNSQNHTGKVLLVDAMGQLPICYSSSRLAILGGSFIEGIGGHNVLEPCLYGTPVFFGPYMEGQTEFAKRALSTGGGRQMGLERLKQAAIDFFADPIAQKKMERGALHSVESGGGAVMKTLEILFPKEEKHFV